MADPIKPDPLGAPNPDDPWWVPPDFPVFREPSPMPPAPPPPPGKIRCPQCGTVFRATTGHHSAGDYGVCYHCSMILIFMANGQPRLPTYDEIVAAEADPRVQVIRQSMIPRREEE